MLATVPSRIPLPQHRLTEKGKSQNSKVRLKVLFRKWKFLALEKQRYCVLLMKASAIHKNGLRVNILSEWNLHCHKQKEYKKRLKSYQTAQPQVLLESHFHRWRRQVDSVDQTGFGQLVDARYWKSQQRRFFYLWALRIHSLRLREKQLNLTAHLKQHGFLVGLLKHWKSRFYDRRIEELQNVRAEHHFQRSSSGKAVKAWCLYVLHRKIKEVHSETAFEFYVKNLLSNGITSWRRRHGMNLWDVKAAEVSDLFHEQSTLKTYFTVMTRRYDEIRGMDILAEKFGFGVARSLSHVAVVGWRDLILFRRQLERDQHQAHESQLKRFHFKSWKLARHLRWKSELLNDMALTYNDHLLFNRTLHAFQTVADDGLSKYQSAVKTHRNSLLKRQFKKWRNLSEKADELDSLFNTRQQAVEHRRISNTFKLWKAKYIAVQKAQSKQILRVVSTFQLWRKYVNHLETGNQFYKYVTASRTWNHWKSLHTSRLFNRLSSNDPSHFIEQASGDESHNIEPTPSISHSDFDNLDLVEKLEAVYVTMNDLVESKQRQSNLEVQLEFLRREYIKANNRKSSYEKAKLQMKLLRVEEELDLLRSSEKTRSLDAKVLEEIIRSVKVDLTLIADQ